MTAPHAYLILAHTNPAQVRKLLALLDDSRNDIYVHIDAGASFGPEALQGSCKESRLTFIPRQRISWGGYSIIEAELALLQEAVRTEHSYYHLLSGQDLPIKGNDAICAFFEQNAGKEFLDLWQMADHTLNRVHYYTLFPEGNRFFLTNMLNHAFKAVLRFLGIRQNSDVQFRQGSQWFSITHGFASYIAANAAWVRRTFSHCAICDEIFVPTLLERSPFRGNLYSSGQSVNHEIGLGNMRLIDWSRGSSVRHPWVFTAADYDMLMSTPHLWARKFDERVDAEIIDKVCSTLRG